MWRPSHDVKLLYPKVSGHFSIHQVAVQRSYINYRAVGSKLRI